MDNMTDINKELAEGQRAERLMEELSPYFDMVKTAIVQKWETSPISDKEGQHELRLMRKLLTDLEANIKTTIDTGKMAQIQIEQESMITKAKNVVRRFA
jgi:hypothetical protein